MSGSPNVEELAKKLDLKKPSDYMKIYKVAGKIEADYWFKHNTAAWLKITETAPDQHQRINWLISMVRGAVLDVGCDVGMVDHFIAAQPYINKLKIVGVDISVDRLKWGQHWHTPVHFIGAHSDSLPFPDKSFDCVILSELLEHVPDPGVTLDEAWRVLIDYGTLLVTCPLDEEKWLVDATLPNPLHVRSFNIEEMQTLLLEHGFKSYAVPSASLGEPYEYSHLTPQGWKVKICQTRMTFIYAVGLKTDKPKAATESV